MTLLPRSLRGRLIGAAAVFILLALAATGAAVDLALHRFVQGQIDQRLDVQLLTIGSALEVDAKGVVMLGRNVDGPPFDNPRTGWFWLAQTPTHTWLSAGVRSADIALSPVPAGRLKHPVPLAGSGPDGRLVRARADRLDVAGQSVVVIAAAPLEALNGPLRDALLPLVTALVVLGLGLVLATTVQVRLGLRPLTVLRDDLAAVRMGGLERLPAGQPDEVRPLVIEMNSLLDQHEANLERARRHVANLAHALKTPLASLAIGLEEPSRDPDRQLRVLATGMDRLIRHHLVRARTAALGAASRSRSQLAPRIADHVAAFGKIYADKGIECRVAAGSDIAVACDGQDLDEVIGNVLDNAYKWARSAIRIEAAHATSVAVVVTVDDDGPGVSPDKLDAVLKPGQRLDEKVSGDGFGLAIVEELTELYGGGVQLEKGPLGGLRVVLTLPA